MINVRFVDAAISGSCNGCSIRMYKVAEITLGRLKVRLCHVCAESVIARLRDERNFLRSVSVLPDPEF